MKKVLISLLLCLCISAGAFAQGTPVIDITAIIAFLENLEEMYKQYEATVNHLQNSQKQLEQTMKNFEKFDPTQLDAKDPLGSWRTIMSYGNRQMNYVRDIEDTMNKKGMKIGNYSYSIADFFEVKNFKNAARGAVEFVVFDPFVYRTPEEKAVFHSKYGMSPANYMRYHSMGAAVKEKAAKIQSVIDYDILKKEDEETMTETIAKAAEGNESMLTQAEVDRALLLDQYAKQARFRESMLDFADGWFKYHQKLEIENEQGKLDRITSGHDYSEGFVNIIDSIDANNFIGMNFDSLPSDRPKGD